MDPRKQDHANYRCHRGRDAVGTDGNSPGWSRICRICKRGNLCRWHSPCYAPKLRFFGARNNLWFTDRAQALVINVWIHGEETKTPKLEKAGIILRGQTQATILDTTISFLADGIIMEDMAQAIIERTTISNTLFGIHIRDAAQTLIVRTHITESEDGVVLTGRCQAQIVDCVIVNNKIGVALLEHAAVVLIGNRIAGNKLYGVLPALHDPRVWFAGFIAGANNVIPGPTESNGNLMGAVYLEELLFLTTEAGGTWCQR